MRGLFSLAAAMVLCAASPAAANWGYYGNPSGAAYGGGAYAPAGYGYAGQGYGGYGYGYATLAQHGAAMPSWGDCPCCNNVWAGYCEEKAARAAKRHCNSCGNGGRCGHGCGLGLRAKSCHGCKSCDTCGSRGGCGCEGGAVIESASADAPPADANPADAPPPAPEAPASEANAFNVPALPGLNWLLSLVTTRQ